MSKGLDFHRRQSKGPVYTTETTARVAPEWRGLSETRQRKGREENGRRATNVGNYRIPGAPAVALRNFGPSPQARALSGRAGKLLIRNSSRDDAGRARWP